MTRKSTRSLLALLLTFALVATLVLGAMPVAAADAPQLRDGEAVIAADASADAINAALSKALIANYSAVGNVEWEYAATNTYNTYFYETVTNNYIPIPQTEHVWVSAAGGTVTARVDDSKFLGKTYAQSGDVEFAAIGTAEPGTVFDVRIAGTEDTVRFTLLADPNAGVTPDPEPTTPDPEPTTPAGKAVVTDSGEAYPVAIAFNDDLSWNYAGISQNIVDAVAPGLGLTTSDVTVKKTTKVLFNWVDSEIAGTSLTHLGAISTGESTVHLTFAGNDRVEPFDLRVTVDLSDQRLQPVIVLKEEAATTYTKDGAAARQGVYANAIDFAASTLPAGITADDMNIEYYATASVNTDGLGSLGDLASLVGDGVSAVVKENTWFDVAGGQYKKLLVTYDVPVIPAGEQQIRISIPETASYKAASVEGDLTVNKANVTVTVRPAIIFPEEAVPENLVTTTPEDDFTIFIFYAGISTDLAPTLYIQPPENKAMELAMKVIDPLYAALNDGKTLTQRFNEGLTVGELREVLSQVAGILNDAVSNPLVATMIDTIGFDSEMISNMLTAIENLPGVFDNWAVALGSPSRAGAYAVAAVAVNRNYNPGFGIGVLIVKQHLFGTKLEWNQKLDGTLTADQAASFDFGATASYNGTPVKQTVKYSFTGFTSAGKLYISSSAPTEAGTYICTAYTFGGNYITFPITRIVRISA